jgi:hypothetical protein
MNRHTQQLILNHLLAGHSLTVQKALFIYRTTELRQYITRIRRSGVTVSDEWMTVDGRRFKRYFI